MPKLTVTAPFDGAVLAELDLHSAADVERALADAAALFAARHERGIPLPERIAILERAADLVTARREELALQAAREGGKPLGDSLVEIDRAATGIREAAVEAGRMVGRQIPMGVDASSAGKLAFTLREPIGPVVAVSAFNHPFNLIVHQVVPAIAVGCPVVVKPAGTTPMSCQSLVEILAEAGLPDGWCRMLLLDNADAEKLVTDARVAFFTFIGSAKIGWMLRGKLAPGARCALEHGGAAPVLVEADADLEDLVPRLVKGGFYHAGQVCVSVQRVFIDRRVGDALCERLVAGARALRVGDPASGDVDVGPLILEREVDRVAEWVEEAKAAGAELLCGGEKIGTTCYAPTVLRNPPDDCRVSREEIFGPVVCVYDFDDRADAIRRANALPFSFQAAVLTKDIEVAFDVANRLDAAAVMINDHTAFRVDWMPFAGRRASGLGVGGIGPAMEEMTEEKLIVVRSERAFGGR